MLQLIQALLDEVEQGLVGIEMYRLHLHFHGQKGNRVGNFKQVAQLYRML
jgi:hypothetical protein